MAEDDSVEPGKENDTKSQGDGPRRVIPGPVCHDDVPHEAQDLHSSRHVPLDVVAEARYSLPFQVAELDQQCGNNYGGNEGNRDCGE